MTLNVLDIRDLLNKCYCRFNYVAIGTISLLLFLKAAPVF